MSKNQETPLAMQFVNFVQGDVWKYQQAWFEKKLDQEKDMFFKIDDDDEDAQRQQRQRVRIIEELADDFRTFVLNSARSKGVS